MAEPWRHRVRRRLSHALERRLVNPAVRRLVFAGRLGSTYPVPETTGRRTGLTRRTPVANGMLGETFWLISAHGPHAGYFQNLLAHPHVRVGMVEDRHLRWRAGTARPLYSDDARARSLQLGRGRIGYRVDGLLLRSVATQLTTVRIDLEPTAGPLAAARDAR